VKRKTCQEDRQVYILEAAQGHPLLHFEDCHFVAVPQHIVSRMTFNRDEEEVRFMNRLSQTQD
jgi:predicted amino acid racemase